MKDEITLRQLRRHISDSHFLTIYRSLIGGFGDTLSKADKIKLLKIGVVFITNGSHDVKKFGYRIITRYSITFDDFKPLFDVAVNIGFIPVSKFIETKLFNNELLSKRFHNNFVSAFHDNFKREDIFLSSGQIKLKKFSSETEDNYVLVAPTSYGKSEIIIEEVYQNLQKKVCIIVPSKALLAQTKKRILKHSLFSSSLQRIITHPDMYKGDENSFVAVLTQERLLRLLQRNPDLMLDVILIDEAHNLMKGDSRAILLAQVLMILKSRKNDVVFKFFTPFISNPTNLVIPYTTYEIKSENVTEFIKIERFHVCDLTRDQRLFMYDQFLNEFILEGSRTYTDDVGFLVDQKADKNIVYLNRPKDIEKHAMNLRAGNTIEITEELEEAYAAISEYVHPEYNLLKCIRSGIVYHHGGMPELVRLYVENLFSKISELQFIVTSSTLLEGVNIPAEKIFLLTTKIGRSNFSKSQFKNLIGRVCRFNEIFNPATGSLRMLEPEIYILKGQYEWSKANPRNFLSKTAKIGLDIKDEVENVLLDNEIDKMSDERKQSLDNCLEYLENIEPNTLELDNINYVESEIAQSCFKNNVYDFDIKANEEMLNINLSLYQEQDRDPISSANEIMDAIFSIFIQDINVTEQNLSRLINEPARRFYSMFLDWRINGSSYNQMIGQFTGYWQGLRDSIIYVGSKWGEIKLNERNYRKYYVDLSKKNSSQRINLAIVRIKEEQDFVDNSLMKYVEIINELGLLQDSLYDQIKYGSTNRRIITLLKNGFSMDLAKLLTHVNYSEYVQINIETDTVIFSPGIIDRMQELEENVILIFEAKYHVR